ncbi:hypothetical protein OEZ85_011983 [Tetradesmus obliquus]|uniref:Uncharacterized protein n=1 Tax=Tetradesmus obliquus TaxID=3088 RepID=A0ABY8TSQ4_TETOB|nr:hypothetical protein OEZ85_011983 [Tetradesmus obliquus]
MQVAAGATQLLQRCCFSNSAAKSATKQQQQGDEQSLTPEQQQHLRALRYLVQRPLEAARNAAMLTALTASYRDLYAIMDQMHKKDILGIPQPLVDDPPAAGAAALSSSSEQQQQQPVTNHTQMFYPVRDFTMLPDQPPPAGGWLRNHLQERYMTRITAFAQLLPNHLEVSYQTGSQIFLWPPMEAYYPGMFDFESMLRYLQPGQKLKRTKRSVRNKRSRCKLGFQRTTPYHKQRVI